MEISENDFKHNPLDRTIETAGRVYTDSAVGPANFYKLKEANYGGGFRQGTFGEQLVLVYQAFLNQRLTDPRLANPGAVDEAIGTLADQFWISGNTAILETPKLLIVQDMPEVRDGRIVMNEKDLTAKLSKNAKKGVRFSDDGSIRSINQNKKDEFDYYDFRNFPPIALTGELKAPEMLASLISQLRFAGRFNAGIVYVEEASQSKIRFPCLEFIYGDHYNFGTNSYSFGVRK